MADANGTCPWLTWYQDAGNKALVFGYYFATPMYLLFGLTGHLLYLLAFYRQSQKEPAYLYQIFITISETLELLAFALYSATIRFSGDGYPGSVWFMSSYVCMWYSNRLATPLLDALITISMLLSLCMVSDRVFALWRPYTHRSIDHKRQAWIALSACVLVGVSASIFDCFRFLDPVLDPSTGRYISRVNKDFVETDLADVMSGLRNALLVLGLLGLVGLNIALAHLYSERNKKTRQLMALSHEKEERLQADQCTLMVLSLVQSTLTSINIGLLVGFYAVLYVDPNFYGCESLFWMPLLDGVLQLVDTADFYVAFACSRQLRTVLIENVPLVKRAIETIPRLRKPFS